MNILELLKKSVDFIEAAVSCDPTKWLCPHCRQRPVATLTKTYYAEISGYVCHCTRIPGSVECQGDAYA